MVGYAHLGGFNLRTHELCKLYELGPHGNYTIYFTNSPVRKLEIIFYELTFLIYELKGQGWSVT